MTAEFFQAEVQQMEAAMYRLSYAILRNSDDCADAVQETLLRAWEKRETLKHMECFQPWVRRILINCCYSMLRRRKRWNPYPLEEMEAALAYSMPEPLALLEAIELLPAPQQLVIALYYIDGYSVQEISDLTSIPVGTVKSRMKKGRDALCILIREQSQEDAHYPYDHRSSGNSFCLFLPNQDGSQPGNGGYRHPKGVRIKHAGSCQASPCDKDNQFDAHGYA